MDENNNQTIIAAVEALLFAYGEPLEIKKIAKLLKGNPNLRIVSESANQSESAEEIIKKSLDELQTQYLSENRGLILIFSGDKVQLATKPAFASFLENFIKEEFKENLTAAALETISLVVYLGPVSRSQIDYYRGVNSSFILRSLLIRGLVDRFPDPKRQNVYLYQPSFDLLKYLGISKIEELPEYEKYKNLAVQQSGQNEQPQNPNV